MSGHDKRKTTELSPRQVRERAGVSQIQAAVRSGTSEPTVRLYEANPDAVKHATKRASLDAYYASLASRAAAHSEPPHAA